MTANVEKWQPTPTFWVACAALVLATIAVGVSVSGVATASPKIIVRKGDIAPGSVTAKALAKGAVTAKALAKGAVTSPKIQKEAIIGAKLAGGSVSGEKLANGSVTSGKLGAGSVTAQAISADSVTASAIAPHSVGGAQLREAEVISVPIADLDKIAHNNEWTPSNVEIAACKAGGRLIGGGFSFSAPNNGESTWLEELPVINGEVNGVAGRFTSDAGGAAGGTVTAVCLP